MWQIYTGLQGEPGWLRLFTNPARPNQEQTEQVILVHHKESRQAVCDEIDKEKCVFLSAVHGSAWRNVNR